MSGLDSVEIDYRIVDAARTIEGRIGSVLLGKAAQVRLATAAMLAGEHLLLNDLPGVGKTTLGAVMAKVVDGEFGRVQGTPDLLPTDLTGSSVFNQATGEWSYRQGPLMANVILVDELNRITPRTQSALLEAMAEGQLTIDGTTHPLPAPFIVVATMNPIGSAGTFPLTAAQLDRFGMTMALGRADRETERRILQGGGGAKAVAGVQAVVPARVMPDLQAIVSRVYVCAPLIDYVLDLCEALRIYRHLSLRSAQSMMAVARALAVLDGRSYVIPDDIKVLAVPCLAHRLAGEGDRVDVHEAGVRMVLGDLAVPDVSRQ